MALLKILSGLLVHGIAQGNVLPLIFLAFNREYGGREQDLLVPTNVLICIFRMKNINSKNKLMNKKLLLLQLFWPTVEGGGG